MSLEKIESYDTLDVVKFKYCLSKPDSLPEYFIFPTDDVRKLVSIIKEEPEKILDIRDLLIGVKGEDLEEKVYKAKTKGRWVLRQKKTGVALLWLVLNKGANAASVKFLNVGYFDQPTRVQEYREYVKKERLSISKAVKEFSDISKKIVHHKPVEEKDFRVEREARLSTVNSGVGLLEMFDSIQTSKEIPFVALQIGGRNLFKSYSRIPPPQIWLNGRGGLEDFGTGDVMLMKVLSFPSSEFSENNPTQMRRIDKFYDEVIWTPDSSSVVKQNVLVDVTVRPGMTYSQIQKRVTDSFLGVDIVFENTRTSAVKAVYYVYDLKYKRAEFVDMLLRDPLISKIFYSNEVLSTTLAKNRFYVYYDPMQLRDTTSASVAFLPSGSKSTDLKVRIARAKSEGEISAFNSLFLSVLKMYEENLGKITKLYEKFIPPNMRIKEKIKKGKEDEELRNIVSLRRAQPELFSKKYSKQCTAAVSILTKKQVRTLKRKGQENRVLEYPEGSGMFFGCNSKKHKNHIYPGLRFNVRPFSEKYEFVPCCYTEPAERPRKHPQGCSERIFGSDKKELPDNTCGYVPNALERFFDVTMQSETPTTILRHSVDLAPDSILYCIEMARNDEFFHTIEENERTEKIKQVRKKLANMESYTLARQELYNFKTRGEISELLKTTTFLDSSLFIRILEKFYGINIVVFELGKDRTISFEIPKHAKSYLSPFFDPTKKTLVLLRVPWRDMPYPAQYEILFALPKEDAERINKKTKQGRKKAGEAKPKNLVQRKSFTFKDPEFIGKLYEAFYATNKVYSVFIGRKGLDKFRISPTDVRENKILSSAKKQYIDSFGKCRILFFGRNLCLFVSPLPPLDIPESGNEISRVKVEVALEFSKQFGLTLVSQEFDEYGKVSGLHFKDPEREFSLCFIPVHQEAPLKEIPKSKKITLAIGNSSLALYQAKRAVASRLVEYSVRLSGILGRFLDENDFFVDRNFDVFQARTEHSSLLQNSKIRIPSPALIPKLLYASKSAIQNSAFIKVQTEQYRSVSDFRILPNTTVFLNESSLINWVKNYEASESTITIKNMEDVDSTLPYFKKEREISLLQNAKGGKKEFAGGILSSWKQKKINPGFDSEIVDMDVAECSGKIESNCVKEKGGKWYAVMS